MFLVIIHFLLYTYKILKAPRKRREKTVYPQKNSNQNRFRFSAVE
jgi:hypothetical protein